MEVISFEYLRKILNEEKNSSNLTKIPSNFYELVEEYIKGKMKLAKEKKDEIEIRNIRRIVENIFSIRERKILNFAVMNARVGVKVSNLTKEEEEFFNKVVALIKDRRKMIVEKMDEIIEGKKDLEKMIVFRQDFPSFVGVDGKVYGPFKKGDIARLPKENMSLLVEKGVAEEFYVEK
ncbi:MAG: hypothetical protein RMJ18_01855 [Candidatus Aenigmarchaeota archaeon]|nr:hypothetical protein [Candidatus Aenigmarchaeota archaeon]MDW8160139.1 hypothetical protein [Candidatus Aenigmarchaeota archaeon]